MSLKRRVEKLEDLVNLWCLVAGEVRRTPKEGIDALDGRIDKMWCAINQLAQATGYEYFEEQTKAGFRKIKKVKK